MTYATSRVTSVEYAEMVSTVASASAGPGTRRNIGEFTFTTARGLEEVGGQGVARRLSSSTWLDRRDILVELRRRQAVAGQEDWILDVAVELAKEKEGVS